MMFGIGNDKKIIVPKYGMKTRLQNNLSNWMRPTEWKKNDEYTSI